MFVYERDNSDVHTYSYTLIMLYNLKGQVQKKRLKNGKKERNMLTDMAEL